MVKNGKSGGSTITGLVFEKETDVRNMFLNTNRFELIEDDELYDELYLGDDLAVIFAEKHKLYRYLKERGVKWEDFLSKKLLPDECLIKGDTIFIVEKKNQETEGSADEKLQTCLFKKEQYERLFSTLGKKVEYIYLLSDWFKKKEYTDTLNFVKKYNCQYYFNAIPIEVFGF